MSEKRAMKKKIVCVVFLILIYVVDLRVVCAIATVNSGNGDYLVINYCEGKQKFPIYYDGNDTDSVSVIPSISMTDYIPRKYRFNKIENLSCKVVKNETIVIILNSNNTGVNLDVVYDVNGNPVNNFTMDNFVYDVNSNVTHLSQSNRINNLITPKGMLKYGNHYYHPEEYCVERITNEELTIKVCEIDCKNKLTPCIHTCCPLGEVFDFSTFDCQYSGKIEWQGIFFHDVYSNVPIPIMNDTKNIRFHYERLSIDCSKNPDAQQEIWVFRKTKSMKKLKAKILKDGSLQYIGPERRWKGIPAKVFCMTGIQNYDDNHPNSFYTGAEDDQLLALCSDSIQTDETVASPYYAAAMLTSSLFLLLTVIVYIILWDKQNLHGWTIMSLVASMFFLFIFLSAAHFVGQLKYKTHSGTFYCIGVGVVAHFFFLSTFCWLSVLNFDVWWTLRCNASLSNRSKGLKRFCLYIVFAWGGPMVVICVGFILQHFFPHRESLVIIPQYGEHNCFVAEWAQGVYIYYILGILFLWNFLFMVLTFFTLYQFRKGTSAIRLASTHQHNSFCTLVKLFFVMGVTWCFEFISWWNCGKKLPWYWIIMDMVNVFLAIGMFIIFVCNKQIIKQLQATHPVFKRFSLRSANQNQSATTNTNTRSSLKTDVNSIKLNTRSIKKYNDLGLSDKITNGTKL